MRGENPRLIGLHWGLRGKIVRMLPVALSCLLAILALSCKTPPMSKENPPALVPAPGPGPTQISKGGERAGPVPEKDVVAPFDSAAKFKGQGEHRNPEVGASKAEPVPDLFPEDPILEAQKRRVGERPNDTVEHLKLAMLYALNKQYPEAEGVLTGLPHRSHSSVPYFEAWNLRMLGEHKAANDRIEQILQERKTFEGFKIERAVLCDRVTGYRKYSPHPDQEILPGGVALLYVEPGNFSLQRENGAYRLWLEYDWKLYTDLMVEISVPAWEKAGPSNRQDLATYQEPVREFHQSFALPLPENLAVGEYRIKVTVKDRIQKLSHRNSDDRYISFRVPPVMGK